MARKTTLTTDDIEEAPDVSSAPDDWQWDTVIDESPTRILFDEIGDVFIGQYLGSEHIELPLNERGEDTSFDLFNFRGRDGKLYAINKSHKLDEGMSKVEIGQWCRITYVKDIPTNRKLNPMKDFTVDVRRA